MIETFCIVLFVAVAWLSVKLRDSVVNLRTEKAERKELEHDLETLTTLSDNQGTLPVSQPQLLTPEAVKCSFKIIRLICICSEGRSRKEAKS